MNHFFHGKLIVLIIISYSRVVKCGIQQQIDDTKYQKGTLHNVVGVGNTFPKTEQSSTTSGDVLSSSSTLNPEPPTIASVPLSIMPTTPDDFSYSSTTEDPFLTTTSDDLSDEPTDNLLVDSEVEPRAVPFPTSEETPHLDILAYNKLATTDKNAFGFAYGHDCKVYGTEIKERQETSDPFTVLASGVTKFTSKENDNDFPSTICKISRRLECIPNRIITETSTVAPLPPTTALPPGVTLPPLPPRVDLLDLRNTPGTCRCIRALSDKAVYIPPDKENKKQKPGCYIPAGFAHSSRCDHIVPIPFGAIHTIGSNTRFKTKEISIVHRHIGNTSLMCVPNAECRLAQRFVIKRCVCKKDTTWNPENGTCSKIITREDLENENDTNGLKTSALPLALCIMLIFAIV